MKNFALSFFILFISASAFAQYNYANLEVDYKTSTSEKTNFTYKNLRLYPIRSKDSFQKSVGDVGKYTPLREALSTKKLVITETESTITDTTRSRRNTRTTHHRRPNNRQPNINNQEIQTQQRIINDDLGGGSATVNTLYIENTSKDMVYIMAGEIVQGGKQDRVIAQDILLPPNSGQVNLSVFCVEQGRWTYGGNDDKSFNQYYGVSSMQLRSKVDKTQNQSEVWQEVARSNEKNKVNPKTGAYTAQLNSEEFKKQLADYQEFFKNKFQNESNVIGVVVVSGSKVVGCDMFASSDLFRSQFNSLLTSYINEAITDGAAVNIQPEAVQNYMDNLLKDETQQKDFIGKKGKMFESNKKRLHISTY